ncbi:hypothetical protein BCR33DRAFT_737766 [Rhizoclosmatium globosum]|uniref:Uncharacterized protein n=1 Tax=Rhizoclosmatium globosum TaxID=329046 RepID=A0A1Y2CCU3_9FUNG|nr:hypothetical protein BCR33DRAFT_737766 [Rhizoclosmatium globosum]|eukprot:ORY44746.1 hypothetical protein BCR33DRAFT_737766 [Rhizoclosmatium globosum]
MQKIEDSKPEAVKYVLLNASNWPVWSKLALQGIGSSDARVLNPNWKPHKNCFARPEPPNNWLSQMKNADGTPYVPEEGEGNDVPFGQYENQEKIWQSDQKWEDRDITSEKTVVVFLHSRMSKTMQAQYARHETSRELWAELKRNFDPANRVLDKSAADKMYEKQKPPASQ